MRNPEGRSGTSSLRVGITAGARRLLRCAAPVKMQSSGGQEFWCTFFLRPHHKEVRGGSHPRPFHVGCVCSSSLGIFSLSSGIEGFGKLGVVSFIRRRGVRRRVHRSLGIHVGAGLMTFPSTSGTVRINGDLKRFLTVSGITLDGLRSRSLFAIS